MIKAYTVALFLLALNVTIMMLTQFPLFGSAFNSDITTQLDRAGNFTYTYNSTNNEYYLAYDSGLIEAVDFSDMQMSGIADINVLEILIMFGNALVNATIFLPFFLSNIGIPVVINTAICSIVWFVYGAGILQIIRGVLIED